jgi:phosphatidylinositol glycan class A protein
MKRISDNGRLNICLVCDFFYPSLGGVEVHVYQLSVALIRRGCKVIILTHHYKNRQGVKFMGNGVKVYYLPNLILHEGTIFPTIVGLSPIFREILIKEQIDIVHCHQVTLSDNYSQLP